MQMSMGCGGDFTTNASVVDQISKRQDVCRVSFKILQLLELLFYESYYEMTFIVYQPFTITNIKIASEGEGRKPSSNREQFIAESEFALLGILSKQCLIIYFYLDSSEQHGWKQK